MSHKLRYFILTIVLLGLLILFIFSPKINGMVIHKDNTIVDCKNTNNYHDCIQCCHTDTDSTYGKEYYGTVQWNDAYNDCWIKHCQKFSN